jgi:Uma2 family endonuclease
MAETAKLVSEEEYLATSYEGDVDYVDGVLEERNVGEWNHSRLIGLLFMFLVRIEKKFGVHVAPDIRVRVRPGKYRVPDLAVVSEVEQVLSKPPLLCVEVLSPEDRLSRIRTRINEYHEMGAPDAWVIDPQTRECYQSTSKGEFFLTRKLTALEGKLQFELSELEDLE